MTLALPRRAGGGLDVAPDDPTLVEDPARQRRMHALQFAQHLFNAVSVDALLGAVAGELPERASETHDGHGAHPMSGAR